jgi:hypothetical protein
VSAEFPPEVEEAAAAAAAPFANSDPAQAEIEIAHKIDFDTGTAAELPWLWDADGSGNNGPQRRFADGNSSHHRRQQGPQMRDTLATMAGMLLPLLAQLGGHHHH